MNRFIVLRDAYGMVQARVPDSSPELSKKLKLLNRESVIQISGSVDNRDQQYRNPEMQTGDIEVVVSDIQLLNGSPGAHPFFNQTPSENTRLKYRFLDLRTDRLQSALRLRAEIVHKMRKYLSENAGFIEIETPTLFRRTPGGAKEFVVPAPKPNVGKFYSLPQSPQQFKQLLMCGGIDRYYQIARCYRNEGAKLDRQPEFTQVDVEMSFTDQKSVMRLIENIILESWPAKLQIMKPQESFKRMRYTDALRLYGTDKPDLRIPWLINDCTTHLAFLNESSSSLFAAKLFVVKNGKDLAVDDRLAEWKRVIDANRKAENFSVVMQNDEMWTKKLSGKKFIEEFGVEKDDAVVISQNKFEFVWITDFPLFVHNDDNGCLESTHHPFTAPIPDEEHLIFKPDKWSTITAQHYDLVLNGVELGGGSIRIHNAEMQKYVLTNILGESTVELHLLDALAFGAPPHGGFAIGLDRYIALMLGAGDPSVPIRDVIAFPKSKEGRDLMTECPAVATAQQLAEYGIVVNVPKEADDVETPKS